MPKASAAGSPDYTLTMAISTMFADTGDLTKGLDQQAQKVAKQARFVSAASTAAFATAGAAFASIAVAAFSGVKSLMAFEDAFAGIRKTVDADAETLAKLETEVRNLATTLPVAATELARVGELGGQLGIKAGNLATFIETVTKLSVATVLSTENAALALARLGAIANIPESQLDEFFEKTASSLVDLGNNFAATEDEIITTVLRIATAAEQSGASTADALAFATALQAIGVPAQAGGTAVSRVFQEIDRAIQSSGEQLYLFAQIAGVTNQEFAQMFAEDSAMAVARFIEGLDTAEDSVNNVQNVLQKLNLSQRRTQLAIGGLATAEGLLIDTLITARNAYEANIALDVEAAKKFATTAQQVILMKNKYKEFTMELGENLLPVLRKVIFAFQAVFAAIDADRIATLGKITGAIVLLTAAIKIASGIMLKAASGTMLFAGGLTTLKTVMTGSPVAIGLFTASLVAAAGAMAFITKEIKAINSIKDDLLFTDLLREGSEFGTGAILALDQITDRINTLKNTFKDTTGIDVSNFLNPDGDLYTGTEKIKKIFEGLEVPAPSDNDLKNYSILFEQINKFSDDKVSLEESLDFIFENQVEKLVKGGDTGFSKIADMIVNESSGIAQEAGMSFLRELLLGGGDPQLILDEFINNLNTLPQDAAKKLSDSELLINAGITPDNNLKLYTSYLNDFNRLKMEDEEAYQNMRSRYEKVYIDSQKEQVNDLERQIELQTDLSDIVRIRAEDMAADILEFEGKDPSNQYLLKAKTDQIIAEREHGRAEMQRLVDSKILRQEDIRYMEFSKTAQEFLAAQKRKQAEEDEATTKNILEALSSSEKAYDNVLTAAKKSGEGIINMFQEVPEQVEISAAKATKNLQEQAALSSVFIQTITELADKGFIALANSLAEQGPSALNMAKEFLANDTLAVEAEKSIAAANESMLRALMEIPDEIEMNGGELRDSMYGVGSDMTKGIANGVTEAGDVLRQALIDTLNSSIEGLKIEFNYSSPPPSGPIYNLGRDAARSIANAFEDEQPALEEAVVQSMTKAIEAAKAKAMSDFDFFGGLNPVTGFTGYNPPPSLPTDPMAPPSSGPDPTPWIASQYDRDNVKHLKNKRLELKKQIDDYGKALAGVLNSPAYKKALNEFKKTMSSSFNTFVSFAEGIRNQGKSIRAITDAQKAYNDVVKEGIDLQKTKQDLDKKVADALKRYGAVGVQTDYERLDIINEELRLLDLKDQKNKRNTASERLAIKDAKRNVEFLEQAVKRGVASEDELQAAREQLADLQGTTEGIDGFQDRESYQKRLDLEKERAELEVKFQQELLDLLKTTVLEESSEVVKLQEELNTVKEQLANQAQNEADANLAIQDAKFEQYKAQLQLLELADELIALGPEGEEQFVQIAKAVGMPENEINNLINLAQTMGNKMATEFNNVATDIFDIQTLIKDMPEMGIDITNALESLKELEQRINAYYAKAGFDQLPFPDAGLPEDFNATVITPLQQAMQQTGATTLAQLFNDPALRAQAEAMGLDTPKAMGGLIDVGNRALVGEFGPELVSVRPSGVHVKPLTSGGGGGIVINNLNVNVTGVPSDPQSARKAAISIRKALVNLEKEGKSSSILGR